jgi:predicted component of type VI protein secretion system
MKAPSIYSTSLADEKYLRNTTLYLAISSGIKQAELITKAPQLVKVCSANHIEHLVRQALPGVPLTHTAIPPSSIPVKLNSIRRGWLGKRLQDREILPLTYPQISPIHKWS